MQGEIQTFLLAAGLNLSTDDLDAMTLESPSGQRCRIDIEVGNVCIEVKRGLVEGPSLERAVEQLRGYVSERTNQLGRRYVGVLTDGARWDLYNLTADGMTLASTYRVGSQPDVQAFTEWLSGVLSTEHQVEPTASAIRGRLGASSSGHDLDRADLEAIYLAHRDDPAVTIKRQLWAKLLTTALGTQFDSNDHDLFVEHTLLVAIAEIVAHAVVGFPITEVEPTSLLSGDLFSRSSAIYGVVERDFFDWPVACGESGRRWVAALARRLNQFDWASTRHDAMKTLYESVIGVDTRKKLGEYYTPDWLAEHMVEEAISQPLATRVLDPACGSGTFLFHAVRRYLEVAGERGLTGPESINGVVGHVAGVDVHPVAVTLARVTYLLAIGRERLLSADRPAFHVPVYLGDSVQWGQHQTNLFTSEVFKVDTVDVHQQQLVPEELQFPRVLLDDADRFDKLVAELADAASERPRNSPRPGIAQIARRHGLSGVDLELVARTFDVMCRLHDEGRDHIWGYFVRNLARPAWLAKEENRVNVLIGNPPWLAYRFMTPTMQRSFKEMATIRGLWSGAEHATQQDLSGLFVARTVEQYLTPGGQFSFVMPAGVLTRGQYEGFRTGRWRVGDREVVAVGFDVAWDLSRTMPPYYFPRTCAVVHGRRVSDTDAAALGVDVIDYAGSVPNEAASWIEASERIRRSPSTVRRQGAADQTSPWKSRFTNGATIFPRVLTTVERDSTSPIGSGAHRVAVRSHRGTYEKKPWKDIETVHGTVELEFVHPLLMGESVLPHRQLDPVLAVLPVGSDGTLIEPVGYPGLGDWWARVSRLWHEHNRSGLSLIENLNYRSKLVGQFPLPTHRVVVAHSGMHVTACRVSTPGAVIEHQLDWAAVRSEEEGLFLCAVLNSTIVTEAATPFMTSGKGGGRHIGKSLWNVLVPLFDSDDPLHLQLVELGRRAESVANAVTLPRQAHGNLRRIIRQSLDSSGVTADIDSVVRLVIRADDSGD